MKSIPRSPELEKYKINIDKLVAFLYTNNEISEREGKNKKSLLKSHPKK